MNDAQLTAVTVNGRSVAVRSRSFADRDYSSYLAPSMGEYPVYDELIYDVLGQDEIRMSAYADAVRTSVAGRTVLDIGTGRDALWAIAAARAGARKVWAVEAIPRVAELARESIARSGLSGTIEVIEGLSTAIELPERVDVCISEIIGTMGGSEGSASVLGDARRRLVRTRGSFVPYQCTTTIAAVDVGWSIPRSHFALEHQTLPYLEAIFESVGNPFDVRLCLAGLCHLMFVSDQVEVEQQEFASPEPATSGRARRVLHITDDATMHGFALGIRLWVTPDGPPIDSTAQSTAWFPVFVPIALDGLKVQQDDRIEIEFSWQLSDDGVHPDYRLNGVVERASGGAHPFDWNSPHHGAIFRASEPYRVLFPAS